MKLFSIVFLLLIFSSCDGTIEEGFLEQQCDNDQVLNSSNLKRMTLDNESFEILIPNDWEVEKYANENKSRSIVGLDTTSLYSATTVKSITLTKYEDVIEDFNSFFKSSLIAVDQNYELVDSGEIYIKSKLIPWILAKDEEYYSITYYFFDKELYMINTTVSEGTNYKDNLCGLLKYVKTLNN
ncbi:MAG: hypothetical protein NXI25_23680 [bacterium]|nr:hypothetical protein [bacterium]